MKVCTPLNALQLLMNRKSHAETKNSLAKVMTDGQTKDEVTTEIAGTPGSVRGRMMRGVGGTGLTRHVPLTLRSRRLLMKQRLVILWEMSFNRQKMTAWLCWTNVRVGESDCVCMYACSVDST